MRLDLEAIFQRKGDLVTCRALEQTRNERLRESILKTAKVIFANNQTVYIWKTSTVDVPDLLEKVKSYIKK
jgi:hypothetical protein